MMKFRLVKRKGDAADDILDGACCQVCGEYFEDGDTGFPRTCSGCEDD